MVANAMTMVDTLHGEFGKFSIALRPTVRSLTSVKWIIANTLRIRIMYIV